MTELSIEKNKLRAIRYDIISASMHHNINEHPIIQMENLGINLIASVPETIGDCWMCLTDYQGKLPDYIYEIELKPHDRYWSHMCDIKIVE